MNKKLEDYSREELIEEIKSLKRRKKFGLVWEDKKEDIVEKCKNEIPVLKEVPELAINEKPGEPTNLIIEGDNFASLQVLNYTHHGKIDVIYIDPPYNTGNKDFIYNDSYVDSEDSFRHSKWLSFMDRRLRLAKELLSDKGIIFVSIDDHEQARLKIICDEIFGEDNLLTEFVWKKKTSGGQGARYSLDFHEYILCYAKENDNVDSFAVRRSDEQKKSFKLKDDYYETRGAYLLSPLQSWLDYRPNLIYPIEMPDGSIIDGVQWTHGKESFEELKKDGRIEFKKTKNGWSVYKKQYENDKVDGVIPPSIIDIAQTSHGTRELKEIFGGEKVFPNPKPTRLIKIILEMIKNKNAIALDFFAGSGTTGQAVLELNKEDGGSRKFILCTNNESNIARGITYPRIKTVVTGIRPDGSKYSDGISANVRYFTTDFIEKGITGDVTRAKLFEKSDEMIQVRENVFELVDKNDDYTFYKNNEKFVAIIKDPFNFGPIWYGLEEKNTEKLPVKLYVFSYSNYTFEDEIPDTDLKYEICAIPNSIMEVYRKISDKKEER